MTAEQRKAETLSLLQDLGLKEYEARCFLALTQLSTGSAKEISEVSEVPRTRVYDAVRVLESRGLVEVQHANPKQFRAVTVEEAAATLNQQFDSRIDTLQSHLEALDIDPGVEDADRMQEVWALSDHDGIESRTRALLSDAESEIVLLIVEEDLLTDTLYERLTDAVDRGVDVIVGGTSGVVARLETEMPSVEVYETELDWLLGPASDDEIAISRLLLVDRTKLLVSSFYPDDDESHEQAVFANGLENGVVVLLRRIISSGLLPVANPER